MKDIIHTDRELCVGCNRCVRECPMELANITYQDEAGVIKVKTDSTKCIDCGRCISACKHKSRIYEDDTNRFFRDLHAGANISLIAAPSVRTNIPDYKKLFTYLKNLGVNKIYDVSLGADICTWAHVRWIEQNGSTPMITQPCPVIVSYCEIYRHDLLKRLSPIHSPMGCVAIYMKEYENIQDKIAALSPCIAKANEFRDTGLVHYNVTFVKLREYLENNNIKLPEEETGFDHYESGAGALYPMPGGLKENIEYYFGKKIHVAKAEGFSVYDKLDAYAETDEMMLPEIFDVLNCIEGCNIGSACSHDKNTFEIEHVMNHNRKAAAENRGRDYIENLYKNYDGKFKLGDYLREYQPVYTIPPPEITEGDIEDAFIQLNKTDYAKQNVDWGACGSETCHHMARKIALKLNIPINCIVKAKETAEEEHQKSLIAYQKNIENSQIIKDALERFETVWNNVESGISIIDADSRVILDVNPIAVRMFGRPKSEIIGNRCHSLICPAENCSCPVLDEDEIVDRSERVFINANGNKVPIIKSVAKIHYNGRLALLENFTDVSHLKEAEERLRLMNVAEQASLAKSDFLSRMSHEMRTPMNAIIGMTSIAKTSQDSERKDYCLEQIEIASTHLLGLINDVLDMSKIEAGKLELISDLIDIEKMLMKVCNLTIEKIEDKHIRFHIEIGSAVKHSYMGDELRLSQVITNLMSNAVKFTPEGGKIELTAREIQTEKDYSILRFIVADSGIGMSEEQVGRLFQAFEQADLNITRKFGGTGLGLAISKSIVEKMNGRIWVESELGKGSKFIFDVKLERPEQDNTGVFYGNIKPADIRLLIVDSDIEERDYFEVITKSFGVNAETAGNGEEAVRIVTEAEKAQRPYNVIFLDNTLDDMDGIAAIEKLNGVIGKNTVIIMMTSFINWNKIEETVRKSGVERYISKPLFPSAILDSINEAISSVETVSNAGTDRNSGAKSGINKETLDFSHITLLLAEDVEINREIFVTLLEDTKMTIDTAENGSIAVQKFKENPGRYDMIIMDVQMPEMDGYEATRTIRSLDFEKAKKIPIVAMTANAFKEDIDKCIASGMNDHLAKPINLDEVTKKIMLYNQP